MVSRGLEQFALHLDNESVHVEHCERSPPVVAGDLDNCAAPDHVCYGAFCRHTPVDHHDEPVALLGFFHVVRAHQHPGAVLCAVADVLPEPGPANGPTPEVGSSSTRSSGL